MNIKPFILAIILANGTLALPACSSPEKPRIAPSPIAPTVTKTGDFKWDNESLKDIIDELAARYNVKICNPQGVIGSTISGSIEQGRTIDEMCIIVNRGEGGHAYVLYLSGTIYVSNTPFPKPFAPDNRNWPCN